MASPLGLAPRVWVIGPPGSGKSTVADALARRLGVEATHLDDLHWAPGWVERPWEDLRRRLEPVLERPMWVVEGNYQAVRKPLLPRAGLVVWLDLPLSVALPRLLARTWDRSVRGTPCCNGNHESLWRGLATKDSILWWALTTDRRRRREFPSELRAIAHVRLRHPAAVSRWLATARP